MSDGHPSYGFAASAWEHRVVDPKDPSTGNINMVNALHSRLREFLAPFHGVATRHLQRYLDWFCYVEQFKRGDMDRRELLFEREAKGTYWTTRRMTHREIGSLMVYWTRQYPCNVNGGLT
ncbi:transposase [Eggerthella lenta]|uniref:transposase n=1 Tax=Eggerthella lenta TaxID=84112 RepID=UPI0011C03DBA